MINCNMCGMSFRSGNAYRKHLLTMHKAWGEDVDENMIPSRVTEAFSIQCGPGWIDVFAKHASDLEKIVKDSPEQTCIFKNKFGRPRFTNPMGVVPEYYESQLQDILHDISEECRSTCETCGKDGERKRMSVTCGDHHECT